MFAEKGANFLNLVRFLRSMYIYSPYCCILDPTMNEELLIPETAIIPSYYDANTPRTEYFLTSSGTS